MANLTRQNWPRGWNASQSEINGDPSALLRMDNLQEDETGGTSLVAGITSIGAFSDYVADIYSKVIGANELLYVSLNANGSSILRSKSGNFDDTITISNGNARGCFGDCLGQVICISGNQLKKDDGTSTIRDLGLADPIGTPTSVPIDQPTLALFNGAWTLVEGTDFQNLGDAGRCKTDVNTLRGTVLITYSGILDTTVIGTGQNQNPLNDTFSILAQCDDTNFLNSVTVYIQMDQENYYSYEWDLQSSPQFLLGINQQSTLSTTRGAFTRQGTDQTLDWTKVTSVQIVGTFTAGGQHFLAGGSAEFKFTGGAQGNLNGYYQYAQVNAYDNGIYVAKSAFGEIGSGILVLNGSNTVTPAAVSDPQVNKIFLYRRSINTNSQLNPVHGGNQSPANNPNLPVSFLNAFYLVATTTPGASVVDNTSDTDALEENVIPNQFLVSMQNLNDTIIGMEGLYNERMLYMSARYIYLSDQLNPDAIDQRYTLKLFGDPTEKNLWIKKLTNNVLIAGTTKNLYEISGTLLSQPDGSLDATITPLGEAYPPLCYQVAASNGTIFYAASDGIRGTTGSNSQLLSAPLNLLFQGQERHGVPPVAIYPNDNARYPITVGKGRLYVGCPLQDGTARLFIYDFAKQNWRLRFTDPITLFTTQKDRVLAGYGFANSLFAFEEGIGGVVTVSGSVLTGVPFTLRTVFDNNQQPRNRKDTFTLKVICDTGGMQVDAYIGLDGKPLAFLGAINCTGLTTNYFQLNDFTLGFRYQIQLVDHNLVQKFKLEEVTIEYEPRPEQQTYLRLLPTNLGSYARKRFTSFAYIIDTLGHTVQFTPYIDNVAVSAWVDNTVITGTKLTHITFFGSEEIGTDIGGIFTSPTDQPFEFYQVNLEETVSEKLPTPCTFLVIPNNNYGTPNRKRHTTYKFVINTRGANVNFTPNIDGTTYPTKTYNTPKKQTVEYFFTASEGADFVGIDIGGIIQSAGVIPFEFYGVITPQQVEELPPRLEYYIIPPTNLGTYSRKRVTSFAMVINTNNALVNFTPLVDGVPIVQGTTTIQTTAKTTFIYYYNEEIIGTDFGGILSSQGAVPFEFYGVNIEETVSEKCPTPMEYLVIPSNDYGLPNRKRHTSYKFQINTRGNLCTFTPTLDGVLQTRLGDSFNFSTTTKQIVEYFFPIADGDVIAKEVGGILAGNGPFEFYQVITPQRIEELPPRLDYYRIPNSNFGHAGKKRFRTIPFVIDTYGQDVSFTPIIDGVNYPPETFNTNGKITVYYYFVSDMFGIDIGGIVQTLNQQPFEFYELGQPENVEILPVPKKYDQLGAIRFDKIGKLFTFRVRLVATGSTITIPFQILTDANSQMNPSYNVTDNSPVYSGNFSVIPNVDGTYEVNMPKSVNGTIIRLVLGPTTDPFHRYDCQMKVSSSGMESDSKWVPVR